jgi:hypothetical protein
MPRACTDRLDEPRCAERRRQREADDPTPYRKALQQLVWLRQMERDGQALPDMADRWRRAWVEAASLFAP